jgi:hypothetical protein
MDEENQKLFAIIVKVQSGQCQGIMTGIFLLATASRPVHTVSYPIGTYDFSLGV